MIVKFTKYDALGNDFLIIERKSLRLGRSEYSRLAVEMCSRRSGAGADGILLLAPDRKSDAFLEINNADGSWAEKSGNGLRMAAAHLSRVSGGGKRFAIRTDGGTHQTRLLHRLPNGYMTAAELGQPDFACRAVPVKSRRKYLINGPLKVGPAVFPVTCLSVGNPHTILLVDSFEFDWRHLGAEIETARVFPERTNVEFVKVISRKKIKVAVWERGAGDTGSSGTGAAASVCAMVMLGLVERCCDVEFEAGLLSIDWKADTDTIEVTGPVRYVMEGSYQFR